MNQLYCPGCGKEVCDFVIYCPYCDFAVQDYLAQQTAAQTAAYFADMQPLPAVPAASSDAEPPPSRPKRKKGTVVRLSVMAGILLVVGVLLIVFALPHGSVQQSFSQPPSVQPPTVTRTGGDWDEEMTFHLKSEATYPHAAVYEGITTSPVCVYMENGEGDYTGGGLGQPLGYLDIDGSVHMESISTTYQYYVLEGGQRLCLVNFDITFDKAVNGLFLYDLQYNNGILRMGCSVSVMEGTTRIVEYVSELPDAIALEAYLTPKGFVNTQQQSILRKGEYLWGGQVHYEEFLTAAQSFLPEEQYAAENVCYASCEDSYALQETISDPLHTLVLYRYTVESGGSNFERGRSVYYCRRLSDEETDDTPVTAAVLPHLQVFYGKPVTKPTYTNDVIGWLFVQPYTTE